MINISLYEIFFAVDPFYINDDFFDIIECCSFYVEELIFVINNSINSLITN